MSSKQIDWLNTGLILLSFILAVLLPFELFVFSYVVIGPLHYFTEIGWLHKRQYFTKGKMDYWWLIALTAIATLGYILRSTESAHVIPDMLRPAFEFKPIIITSLLSGAVMIFVDSKLWRWLLFVVIYVASVWFITLPSFLQPIIAFVPNLIHVYLFMGAFMLQGALKSRSLPGFLNIALLAIAAIVIVSGVFGEGYHSPDWALHFMQVSGFSQVPNTFTAGFDATLHPTVIKAVQIFLAFSYTYHYANWFSKTSIIGWHKVNKINLVIAAVLWAACIVLYFYDAGLAIMSLFFFSLLHVFLELPLNAKSFQEIFRAVFRSGQ